MKQNICDVCKKVIEDEKFVHQNTSIGLSVPFTRKGTFYGRKGQRAMEAKLSIISLRDEDNEFIREEDDQPHVCLHCVIDAVNKLDDRPKGEKPKKEYDPGEYPG